MAVVGSQFSTGDQSPSARETFWASGFRKCPNQCSNNSDGRSSKPGERANSTIASEDHVAGCRLNGDAYGTTVFRCSSCNWQTSFQYDEASETYYYETKFWRRPDSNAPPKPQHPWSGVSIKSWLSSHPSLDKTIVDKCSSFGLLSDGPRFSDLTFRHFKALSFTKKEAELLVQVIEEKNKELGLIL
ncbi:unnamed protein product [Cylindrotheca closterium]|uniref:Uncharacterized protein n=1 Tax=Cylindrotheca closterium TaxID=2856 RepID=A0AAD2G8P8_9STRA|nr:unnamed protein product [Cylindrotheca closterium]